MYIIPDSQLSFSDELNHHGILGMKWGIRRFQPYPDGEKKGKEVGEAARKRPRKTLGDVGRAINRTKNKAMTPVTTAKNAISNKIKENKQFEKDAIDFYKKHGDASKPTKKGPLSEGRKNAIASIEYGSDKYLYGKKGVKRIINKVENKGKTIKQAKRSEFVRSMLMVIPQTIAGFGMAAVYAMYKSGKLGSIAKTTFNKASDRLAGVGSILSDGTVKAAGRTLNSDLFLPFRK